MCNLIKSDAWKLDILHTWILPFPTLVDNRLPLPYTTAEKLTMGSGGSTIFAPHRPPLQGQRTKGVVIARAGRPVAISRYNFTAT